MITNFYPPVYSGHCVESFFTLEHDGMEEHIELILPDGTAGLIFLHSGEIARSGDAGTPAVLRTCHVFGQKSRAVQYHIGYSSFSAFGVKLKPHTLFDIFRITGNELADGVVDAESMDSKALGDLAYKIFESTDLESKIAHVESFLLSHGPGTSPDAGLSNHVIDYIIHHRGIVRVNDIHAHFGVHYKKLERLFKRYVGLTPKHFARIIRLNATFFYLTHLTASNLTDLTYASGYFDQMHFVREVKAFTGRLPSHLYHREPHSLERAHRHYLAERLSGS